MIVVTCLFIFFLNNKNKNKTKEILTIIIKELRIFLQNVYKNYFLTDFILENNKNFDIIFIQEFSWSVIRTIPSLTSEKDKKVVGTLNYLL